MTRSGRVIKFNPPYNATGRCFQNDNRFPTTFQSKKKPIAIKFGLSNPRSRRRRDRNQIGPIVAGAAPRACTDQHPSDEGSEGKKNKRTQSYDERQQSTMICRRSPIRAIRFGHAN